MPYPLQDNDYLDLWKYFQDRADNVKEAMFNSVTWALGFAAAVLGFIVGTQIAFATLTVAAPAVLIGAAAIGLVLCCYCVVLVAESRKHILRNWASAERCRAQVQGLDAVLDLEGKEQPRRTGFSLRHVWNQVLCIVAAFALCFAALIAWGAASLGA